MLNMNPAETEKTPRWLLTELHSDLLVQAREIAAKLVILQAAFDKLSTGENSFLATIESFDAKAKAAAAYLNETVKLSDAKFNDGAKQFENSLSSTIMRYAELTSKIAQQSAPLANRKINFIYLFSGIFIGLIVSLLIYAIFK